MYEVIVKVLDRTLIKILLSKSFVDIVKFPLIA